MTQDMPYKGFRSTSLPREVVDEVQEFLATHREKLKRMGIKKISHVFERAWYRYKDYLKESL